MKKKILAIAVLSAMLISTLASCNQPVLNSDTAEPAATSAATEPAKKTSKINTKNLSETSKPIGVSELSARAQGSSSYVSGKITNNNDDFEESNVTLELEILNSSGKVVSSGSIECDRALSQGETYVFDEYLGYIDTSSEEETYTVKVVDMNIEDGAIARMRDQFESDLYSFGYDIEDEKYNSAQLKWENIKETYGSSLSKEIKETEAKLKDLGLDPDNISAGITNASQSPQSTESSN
ncbi:MAG: hypothetical protein PUF72_05765 [Clostridiales bacterium]|nr:hypothetical protein [Clostridiales bacterium]